MVNHEDVVQRAVQKCLSQGRLELDLSGLGLTQFDDQIDLLPPEIATIDLSKNAISAIDPRLFRFPRLRHLFLGYNKIDQIPPGISQLQSLHTLSLKRNRLTSLPAEVGKLTNLRILNVAHNRLDGLPPALGNLSELNELIIYGNSFVALPSELNALNTRIDIDDANLLRSVFDSRADWMRARLRVPDSLQTPLIQYLNFFNDYFAFRTDQTIGFEVRRVDDGLEILAKDHDEQLVTSLLHEYVGYIRLAMSANEDAPTLASRDLTNREVRQLLFTQELRNQIQFLRMKLEGRDLTIRLLNQQLEQWTNLALVQANHQPQVIVQNRLIQSATTFIHNDPELVTSYTRIAELLGEIRAASRDAFVENEVEKLNSLLDEARAAKTHDEYRKTGITASLMRFLEKANDATTNLGQVFSNLEGIGQKLSSLKEVVLTLLNAN